MFLPRYGALREYGDVKLFYVEPEGYYEGQMIDKFFRCLDPDVDNEKVARSSIRYFLQRLEALGLIRMRQENKKVVIEVTKTGELYGKAR